METYLWPTWRGRTWSRGTRDPAGSCNGEETLIRSASNSEATEMDSEGVRGRRGQTRVPLLDPAGGGAGTAAERLRLRWLHLRRLVVVVSSTGARRRRVLHLLLRGAWCGRRCRRVCSGSLFLALSSLLSRVLLSSPSAPAILSHFSSSPFFYVSFIKPC
jgi:hypothetical protein